MGDISIRESIRWLPDEASEPTSTIVLTSPEHRFVDLRILLDAKPSSGGKYPFSALDWGIAGTSSSTLREPTDAEPPGQQISHAQWRHWINSRTADVENAADEGDNFPQPDGSILEKGRMVNPATGRETNYEEVWRSATIEAVPCFPDGEAIVCVVLKLQHDEDDSSPLNRGMIVRLGQYCQAIVRKGEGDAGITVERLKWDGATEEWVKQVRIGDAEVPTDFATYFGTEATLDDDILVGGDVWRVVEKS
ncbi:hypothetical protein B0T25DRAFT_455437 [Lasiosphaeria hispida]|uniref:Protein HRI1 n=1 Tax=Lasiosphaeria hispida TaxID=260671 RepID=A0AAJ0HHE4_9PEZI|nr:hypothetical protein B0T25DRAFT_455437 [Lasiosphaeria hispida]